MKALFWVFVALGCIYVFYSASMAIWAYLEVTSVVEEVVPERAGRNDRAERVKEDIAKKVAMSGIKVDDRAIFVTDEGRTLTVGVAWRWPLIAYQGEEYLTIPLSHERTFKVPEPRR
jgi:hypothetical protein